MFSPDAIPIGFYSAWCDVCGCESLRKLGNGSCLVCDEQTLV
jgi:hypothetical protein